MNSFVLTLGSTPGSAAAPPPDFVIAQCIVQLRPPGLPWFVLPLLRAVKEPFKGAFKGVFTRHSAGKASTLTLACWMPERKQKRKRHSWWRVTNALGVLTMLRSTLLCARCGSERFGFDTLYQTKHDSQNIKTFTIMKTQQLVVWNGS